MTLSIATSAVPGDLPQKLKAVAAAGFTGVELFEQDFIWFDGAARDVARLADDLGLTINLLQPFEDLEGLQGKARVAAFDRLENAFDRMGDLGTGLLLVQASTRADALGPSEDVCSDVLDLVQSVDCPNLGIALNSFFSLADGSRPARLGHIPGDKIFHVQLSDAPRLDMDLRHSAQHFRLFPGQGDLNLAGFLRVLSRAGYKGPWSLDGSDDVTPRNGAMAVAGAFIADKPGAGVQHIAFLSDDIFETSDLLAASGFPRLAIPANYYSHLQSTCGLDEDLTRRTQEASILYSGNEGGEYFQIYSQPIFNGFFFEIVQRRNGFAGYGARNAPVRVTAQSRLRRPAGMPLR